MRTAVQWRGIAETEAEPESTAAESSDPRFTETPTQRVRRWVLGVAYALRPNRIALVPRLALMSLGHLVAPADKRDKLPDHPVYYSSRGLVGISDDLSVEALVANYKRGYFPVCHMGAMKWWCPEERASSIPPSPMSARICAGCSGRKSSGSSWIRTSPG